ncbi:MAG: DUF1634 domain-containing protein [Bryobacteraceae bacterium]
MERAIGLLLRTGVWLSAAVVFAGGAFYLAKNGSRPAAFHTFHPPPPPYRSVRTIAALAAGLDSAGIVQLGLLLLIATPVARVAFSAVAFALERDRTYILISLAVLGILLFSLAYAR